VVSTDRLRRLRPIPDLAFPEVETRMIHGYRRAFRMAGGGPAVLLLHGIGDDSSTWRDILPDLARDHLVIAPDLLGHGASDKPRGDYSVGGFANGLRDLLSVLDIERVTLVGHSLGGGVAMQFAYQYPQRCERLVLVGAGGVAHDVHPLFRALALPGGPAAVAALRFPPIRWQLQAGLALLQRLDTAPGADADDMLRIAAGLPDRRARRAFVQALRTVVDARGQVATMLDRSYLMESMPAMLVWGTRDAVVPVRHARLAHAAMPGSRLEIFEGAGHFPFRSDPNRFLHVLRRFIHTTAPAPFSPEVWRELLGRGSQHPQTLLRGAVSRHS
jgi:pimeloyl-ACP methyl ester carboxylesterase